MHHKIKSSISLLSHIITVTQLQLFFVMSEHFRAEKSNNNIFTFISSMLCTIILINIHDDDDDDDCMQQNMFNTMHTIITDYSVILRK